jgi:glycosyltransferase involved in cell wall biosynthesis
MRIAFLGSEGVPYPNAFAHITEQIGTRLVDRGHEVLVYGRKHFVPESTPYRGMQRVALPSLNTKHFDTISFVMLSALHLLRTGWADVAHIHGIGPSTFAKLPRLRGTKSVVHLHALDWQRAKWGGFAKRYLQLSETAAVRLPDATVVVSETLKAYVQERYNRVAHYVPQGVEPPEKETPSEILSLGLEPRGFLLFMGRLVPEKGVHYLVEAYRRLTERGSMPPLIIAGGAAHTDSYATELKASAPDGVQFLGHVDGRLKRELLTHAGLFVQPSELEGLSLGLLEAMSYGNAVLASDIPENVEAASTHAAYFHSKDVDHLTEQLGMLLDSPSETLLLGERGAEFVTERYSWDHVASEMEAVYQSILRGGARSSAERDAAVAQ